MYIDKQVEYLSHPVRVHESGVADSGSGLRWYGRSVGRGLLSMGQFSRQDPPDVVHVHTSHRYSFYRAAFYVLYARHVWHRPVVLHVHGSSFHDFVADAPPALAALQRRIFDASDRIIVLSEYWRSVVSERADPDRIHVVPNAVDPSTFETGPVSADPHLVMVSNLIERKGVREFVSAVDSLAARLDRPFEVSIAGSGPLAPLVESLADRHECVTYHGYVSEAEKRSLLASGSIFVLPTHAEGLPFAMLEGMAAGNAIVSTTVGAIPEVIDDDRGVLVSPGDVTALEAALADLVGNDDRCREMAAHNRRAVEEEYSWGAVIDQIERIYDSLLADDPA